MIFVHRDSNDPYINLATEEFVFDNFTEDVTMLWISDPCIVIGKHQNAMAEINLDFVEQKNIPVIRRLSGGGTVYHDHGNLNYTLIRKGRKTQLIDYAEHTRPIINALKELSVEARLEGKSNLTTGGLKFSGNSEHIIKTRILHHGTLLFNTNLEELERALSMKHTDYEDKAVKSIRSKVTNIQDHLLHPMSILEFRDYLIEFFQRLYTSMHMYHLSEKEIYQIQKLAEEKYKSWEWNFGYSPIYKLERSIDITGELLHLSIEIEKGRIKNFTLVDQLGEPWDTEIQQKLLGLPHDKKVMLNTLNNINFASSSGKIKPEKFIEHLF